VREGDQGAFAGVGGFSSSPARNPSGRTPGGQDIQYYPGAAGTGGLATSSGNAGAAVLLFDRPGAFVHNDISFVPIKEVWVKVNDVWQKVQAVYVKDNGVWVPTVGSVTPVFSVVSNNFGVSSRSIPPEELPVFDFGGGGGGGTGDNTTGPGTVFGGGFTVDYNQSFDAPTESA
jgi:hypothetical protein